MKLKTTLAGTAVLVALLGAGPLAGVPLATSAYAQTSISVSVFYDDLAEHGDWVEYDDRYVFVPTDVDSDWRPYTKGHWAYADRYGWTWASDEPFGWATYHYGRWGHADDIGWYWVPGTVWGPAWVGWRRSENYVVWAPLPPDDDDRDADRLRVDVRVEDIPDFYWVAVDSNEFLDDDLGAVIISRDVERRRILEIAEPIGTVRIRNNIVVNNVLNVRFVQEATGREVRRLRVREASDPRRVRVTDTAITAFTGRIRRDEDARPRRLSDLDNVQRDRDQRRQRAGDEDRDQPGSAVIDEDDNPRVDSGDDTTGAAARDNNRNDEAGKPRQRNQAREERRRGQQAGEDSEDGSSAFEDEGDTRQDRQRRRNRQADEDQPGAKKDKAQRPRQRRNRNRQTEQAPAFQDEGDTEQQRRDRRRNRASGGTPDVGNNSDERQRLKRNRSERSNQDPAFQDESDSDAQIERRREDEVGNTPELEAETPSLQNRLRNGRSNAPGSNDELVPFQAPSVGTGGGTGSGSIGGDSSGTGGLGTGGSTGGGVGTGGTTGGGVGSGGSTGGGGSSGGGSSGGGGGGGSGG